MPMKNFILVTYFRMIITMAACLSGSAFAVDGSWMPGECRPINSSGGYVGSHNFHFNFIKQITDLQDNDQDKSYTGAFSWNDSSSYYAQCYCSDNWPHNVTYYKAQPPTKLVVYKKVGNKTYYKINENLAFAMQVYLNGRGYFDVPFTEPNSGNGNSDHCTSTRAASGASGSVDLLIIKPFIGSQNIPTENLIEFYGSVVNGSFGSIPLAVISMAGSVTVQQSCEVNAGNSVQINFGDMYNGNFKGQGSKPEGVNSKTIQLGYKCHMISKGMDVKMRFTGQSDSQYSTAFATTNPDIGVVIEDGNGNLIAPNTGSLPMTVDYDTQTGSVNIITYPVSTTGNIPVVGQFTSRATVVVDFQ